MINKSISELYDSGYISGDAFLYYAERNLGTIQDIMDAVFLKKSQPHMVKKFVLV